MAHLIESSGSRYQLSREEEIRGSVFNSEQKMVLQNQSADIVDQLLTLKFDPLNPTGFALEQAHLQGQLDFVRYLRNNSDSMELILSDLIKQNREL